MGRGTFFKNPGSNFCTCNVHPTPIGWGYQFTKIQIQISAVLLWPLNDSAAPISIDAAPSDKNIAATFALPTVFIAAVWPFIKYFYTSVIILYCPVVSFWYFAPVNFHAQSPYVPHTPIIRGRGYIFNKLDLDLCCSRTIRL